MTTITVYGHTDCPYSRNFKNAMTASEFFQDHQLDSGRAKTINFTYVDCKAQISDQVCPDITSFPAFVYNDTGRNKICKAGFQGDTKQHVWAAAREVANKIDSGGCNQMRY